MFVAGVDIGSAATKVLVMDGRRVVGWKIVPVAYDSLSAARAALQAVLEEAAIPERELGYIVSTGYGRASVPFAMGHVTEISCHAKGMHWLFREVHTILDVGGQDCKAIRCDDAGNVREFVMNDKCAAGTGRFVERVASALHLSLDEVGPLSLQPGVQALPINGQCAVFATADVLRFVRAGEALPAVLAGVFEALATRLCSLVNRLGVTEKFAVSGGLAKNQGLVKRVEQSLGVTALVPAEPQVVGALGAALFAYERLRSQGSSLPLVEPVAGRSGEQRYGS